MRISDVTSQKLANKTKPKSDVRRMIRLTDRQTNKRLQPLSNFTGQGV